MNTGQLRDRRILVTGASSGVGAHVARMLAGEGAHVVAAARRTEALEALVREIESAGGSASAVRCDVSDEDSIAAAFDAAGEPVDSVIVNAGVNAAGPAIDLSSADFDRIMGTNLRGAFLTAREAGRRMVANAGALGDRPKRIVLVASILGLDPAPGAVAYAASKAGVIMLARGLAREWARHGINVNALCPGYMKTEIVADWFETELGAKQIASWPRRKLMAVNELDGVMLYLLSAGAAATTGAILKVDDAQSL